MKLFIVLALFVSTYFFGQTFITTKRYPTSEYKAETKDNSELTVVYTVGFSDGKGKQSQAFTILQIGEKFSKFIDINTPKKDSLLKSFSLLENIGAKELNELGKYNVLYKKNVLKDWFSNKIFVQERFGNKMYQFEEVLPKKQWILTNDKATILGYNCKSAKLNFRGRNYTAWYSEEIPKNEGPYLFDGLPGLILKISDDENNYIFTAIGIEKRGGEIYWRNEKKIISVSRDEYRRIQRNYFENPSLFLTGKAYDSEGREISPTIPKRYYNPLELE